MTVGARSKSPLVAAVIVTYNRCDVLRESLSGLLAQTRPVDEVLVVDNASTDDTAEMVAAEFPSVRLTGMPDNAGFAGGCAEGLRVTTEGGHDWAWVFNDDDIPDSNALEVMIAAAGKLPAAGILGCCRRNANGLPIVLGARWNNRHVPVPFQADTSVSPIKLDVVTFSGSLIATSLTREIGVPKADYFMMVEDLEYCLRARRGGWNIYVLPQPLTTSRNLGSGAQSAPWRGYYQTRNQLAMTLEHRSVPELWWWAVRNAKFCAGTLRSGDRRGERLRLRALGAWHALRGVSGPTIPPRDTAETSPGP